VAAPEIIEDGGFQSLGSSAVDCGNVNARCS
jgi:hypothetical protein